MGWQTRVLILWSVLPLFGCTVATTTIVVNGRELYEAGPSEVASCSAQSFSGATITLSGNATYHARQVFDNGNGDGGLGAAPGAVFPIRFAEVHVLNSGGSVVQCGRTDGVGHYSVVLPKSPAIHTVRVYSRSPVGDPDVQVSVLNRPSQNSVYFISGNVSASADTTLPVIDASVSSPEVMGGAFNIMDQILKANEFLHSVASTCNTQFTGCPAFTVAPKVSVYWSPGFDPSNYAGQNSPISFYLPGYGRLFILGGVNGDTDNHDTDHFDNSIIIHEYGHFLEDNVFRTNSPGGSHDGDAMIDPRLAWSEGWGNFFQAAVQNSPHYYDTYGNVDGMTGFYYNADLETPHVGNDYPEADGEGNFREFSITRFLWDTIDDTPTETRFSATDNIHDRFIEIWAALTRSAHGFMDPNYAFLSVGWVHLAQEYATAHDPLANGSDFSGVRGVERHRGDTGDYAQYLSPGACATFAITPTAIPGDDGSFQMSDLMRNNKFFYLKMASPTSGPLELRYQDADGVGDKADLDLFLYNEKARFGNSDDWVGVSSHIPNQIASMPEYETITLSNLAPGNYLINVHIHTADILGGPVTYTLKLNGSNLCPTAL
jgi:hypothetical protein